MSEFIYTDKRGGFIKSPIDLEKTEEWPENVKKKLKNKYKAKKYKPDIAKEDLLALLRTKNSHKRVRIFNNAQQSVFLVNKYDEPIIDNFNYVLKANAPRKQFNRECIICEEDGGLIRIKDKVFFCYRCFRRQKSSHKPKTDGYDYILAAKCEPDE